MFDRLSAVFKCPLNVALGFPDKAPADEGIRVGGHFKSSQSGSVQFQPGS